MACKNYCTEWICHEMKHKSWVNLTQGALPSQIMYVVIYKHTECCHSHDVYRKGQTVCLFPECRFVHISVNRVKTAQFTYSDLLSQKYGLFMAMLFSCCSVSVSVALNSSVCRLAGRTLMIVSRSLVKSVQPCSNSRSASSMIWHTERIKSHNCARSLFWFWSF